MRFKILAAAASLFMAAGTLSAPAQETSNNAPLLAPADLDQLVAPIALYPDPLVALVLQASTVPTDVVLAERYLQNGGDPNDIDQQNWDDSVKGLARYPDVLQMMDENLDWTNQLGAAVLAQQDDVMNAIQVQRTRAYDLGNLESTSQQQVIDQDQIIQIVPADPQLIYVPVYDPQVIYVDRGPSISFGIGLALGAWISGGFDWHHHGFYSHGYYRPGYGWRPQYNNRPSPWRPNPSRPKPRPPYNPHRPGGGGKLPGWTKPSPGHGNRPGHGGSNRPPGNVRPTPQRPGHGNNRLPGNTKPAVQKPGTGSRPDTSHRPGQNIRPGNIAKPAVRPSTGIKPSITRPSGGTNHAKPTLRPTRPTVTKPTAPAPRAAFNPRQEDSKRPAARPSVRPAARPAPQAQHRSAPVAHRPAPQKQKPSPQKQRPAPQKK